MVPSFSRKRQREETLNESPIKTWARDSVLLPQSYAHGKSKGTGIIHVPRGET